MEDTLSRLGLVAEGSRENKTIVLAVYVYLICVYLLYVLYKQYACMRLVILSISLR